MTMINFLSRTLKFISVLLLMILFVSGCLSPVQVPTQSSYLINTTPSNANLTRKHARVGTLLVMLPETSAAYNTQAMAYSTKPYQISYYSQNSWAETPAQMLQNVMIETLTHTEHFRSVVMPPFMGRADYVLDTQLLSVLQDYTHQPVAFELKMRARLTRADARLIATREFVIRYPMQAQTPYAGVLAANLATKEMLRELALFCLQNAR